MTATEKDDQRRRVLDAERSVNEQYREEIQRKLDEQPGLFRQIGVIQSHHWTRSDLPNPSLDRRAITAVIGRVALEDDHPDSAILGQNFYIAGWRLEMDGFETINWAAPIASLFFKGSKSEDALASYLLGRRTFVLQLDDIVDFEDEVESEGIEPFAAKGRSLEVPEAPTRRRPPTGQSATGGQAPGPAPTSPSDAAPQPADGQAAGDGAEQGAEEESTSDRLQGLRAAEAVAKVMEQPKQGRMGTVLPTMQPIQYELVSASGGEPLIVQGQPGTGKTVIAAHRAVFLTSAERKGSRVARVAVVGPSDHYVDHIAPIIAELKEPDAEIRVYSLPGLLASFAGLRTQPKIGPIGRIESSWELGRAVASFVEGMSNRPTKGPMDRRVRVVTDALRSARADQIPDPEIRDWLRDLPIWSELSTQVRYLPMLATIGLSLDQTQADRVGHIIIDEAQDVRPIEWKLLSGSLLEANGGMSLFGDMNQRRSDWTASTWHDLAVDLELTDEDGASDIRELSDGYRSTRQILRFANQLLPRGERTERALRDGPRPDVRQVGAAQLLETSVDAAVELAGRHEGYVALLALDWRSPTGIFRKRGWTRGNRANVWSREGRTVWVLTPDDARGLEFDGVVVVEPSAFPENVGRQGVLYTSLTRANKELTVLYTKGLPGGLRKPR
jgi:hypothetical protein